MSLSPAQNVILKAAILADPVLATQPSDGNGLSFIADAFNAVAVPDYIVWRSNVTAGETGNAWVGTDIDGMSALNMQRLQLMLASSPQGVFDMSRADRRAGFENPFGASASNASRIVPLSSQAISHVIPSPAKSATSPPARMPTACRGLAARGR